MEGHAENKGSNIVSSGKIGDNSQRHKPSKANIVPLHGPAKAIAGSNGGNQGIHDWSATFDAITD